MPLTTRRWRLTLVGVCAAALLLALRFGEANEWPGYLRHDRDRTLFAQQRTVVAAMERDADAYTRQQLATIADRHSAATDRSGSLTVVGTGTFADDMLPPLREALTRELATLGLRVGDSLALRVPLQVIVLPSPRDALPGIVGRDVTDAPFTRFVRPPRRAGEPCTLLLTVRNVDRDRIANALSSGRGVLGPCAFFAAFGFPGRALRAHLDSVAWHPAAFARWNDSIADDDPPRRAWSDLSANGVRCLARGDAACARTWAQLPPASRWFDAPSERSAAIAADGLAGALPWFSTHGRALGVRQRLLFSDLVRDVGTARFGDGWRRDAPVDAFFTELVGEDEGAWMSRWLARSYAPVTPSPHPSRADATWWLIGVAGSVASVLAVRGRRAT